MRTVRNMGGTGGHGKWPSPEEGQVKAGLIRELRDRFIAERPVLVEGLRVAKERASVGIAADGEVYSARKDLEALDNAVAAIPEVAEEMERLGTVATAGARYSKRRRIEQIEAELERIERERSELVG